jgi:aminopeptidase N
MLRQLRRWSLAESDQGPVYLGYRLGHVRDNARVFRALVYNKGAAVLHMLRRLIGDEAFFSGLRQYYLASCFSKASTEDLRLMMEAAAGRSLQRFFERWIYGATLPQISFSYRIEPGAGGQAALLRFEQTGDVFDVPVTAMLHYANGRSVDVPVALDDRTVEVRVPLTGPLRSIDISKDDGTVAEVALQK